MPEHIMPVGTSWKEFKALDAFTQGYVHAIFFTECNSNNPELEDATFDDISPEMMQTIVDDCANFQTSNADMLERAYKLSEAQGNYDESRAGTDFWFTRNRHGAGFWDRGLSDVGNVLTNMAHAYGSSDLYAGDNGKLYLN